jgi:hypothetical protein
MLSIAWDRAACSSAVVSRPPTGAFIRVTEADAHILGMVVAGLVTLPAEGEPVDASAGGDITVDDHQAMADVVVSVVIT